MTFPVTWADYTVAAGNPASLSYTAGAGSTNVAPDPAVKAGQLLMVDVAGEVVPTAGAGPAYVGVAGNDAVAGGQVTVLCGSGVIHETAPAADVAAGQFVPAGAGGLVGAGVAAPAAGTIGVVVRAGTAAVGGATPVPAVPCRWLAYR